MEQRYEEWREQAAKEMQAFWTEAAFELSRSSVAVGLAAVRALILINGGAAVAVLAFFSDALASQAPQSLASVPEALTAFSTGVALAGAAMIAGYIAQGSYALHITKAQLTADVPFIKFPRISKIFGWIGVGSNILGALCALLSLAAFVSGFLTLSGLNEGIMPLEPAAVDGPIVSGDVND